MYVIAVSVPGRGRLTVSGSGGVQSSPLLVQTTANDPVLKLRVRVLPLPSAGTAHATSTTTDNPTTPMLAADMQPTARRALAATDPAIIALTPIHNQRRSRPHPYSRGPYRKLAAPV